MFVDRQVDDQVVLRNPGHFNRTLSHLSKLRREGVLCDVTLLVEGQDFRAHKSVLAACSEYFKAMFTSSVTQNSQSEFVMETISSEVFEQILAYIYDGSFNMDMTTVVDMLHAASLLLIKDIQVECFIYMKRSMNITNCLHVRRIAEAYSNKDLIKRSTEYIKKNFERIIKEKEVLNTSFQDFKFLLSNDDISCKSEDTVARLVQSWLSLRSDIKLNELQLILKCLRLPYLSKDGKSCLQSTMKDLDEKNSCKEFTTALNTELKHQSRSNRRKTIDRRLSQKSENVIFCVSYRGETFCYHVQSKKFRLFERFPEYRQPGHLVVHEDIVYATGGLPMSVFLNPVHTAKLYSYNITDGKWSSLPAMNFPRTKHNITFLSGKLYVIGGHGGGEEDTSRSLECYDPVSKTWSHSTSTNFPRVNSAVTSSDKYIYVMGGESVDGSLRALNNAERFCPRKETWLALPNLHHKRVAGAAVFFNGKVFVFGGGDGLFDLNNFEYLDSSEKRWTVVALPYTTPISTALCMEEKIIALGSSNWGQDLALVNSFVRRRGVNWKVIRDFIHPSHRIKSMKYAVINILNYDLDCKPEAHCDCSSFDEDSSIQESFSTSDDELDPWLDEPDPWGIWI